MNEKRSRDGQAEDSALAQRMIHRKIELFKKHSGFILVEDYEKVEIPDGALKDKDDIHVLKAALKSNCSVLLTLDKDFRKISSLTDLEIVAKKADDFFCELFDKYEEQMMDVINRTRKGLERQRSRDIDLLELV